MNFFYRKLRYSFEGIFWALLSLIPCTWFALSLSPEAKINPGWFGEQIGTTGYLFYLGVTSALIFVTVLRITYELGRFVRFSKAVIVSDDAIDFRDFLQRKTLNYDDVRSFSFSDEGKRSHYLTVAYYSKAKQRERRFKFRLDDIKDVNRLKEQIVLYWGEPS